MNDFFSLAQLEAGDNQYLHIPVLPTIIGEDVDITISATTLIFTDTITKTVRTRVSHCPGIDPNGRFRGIRPWIV